MMFVSIRSNILSIIDNAGADHVLCFTCVIRKMGMQKRT